MRGERSRRTSGHATPVLVGKMKIEDEDEFEDEDDWGEGHERGEEENARTEAAVSTEFWNPVSCDAPEASRDELVGKFVCWSQPEIKDGSD